MLPGVQVHVVFPICMAPKALFGLSRTYNVSKLLIKLPEGKLQSGLIFIFSHLHKFSYLVQRVEKHYR